MSTWLQSFDQYPFNIFDDFLRVFKVSFPMYSVPLTLFWPRGTLKFRRRVMLPHVSTESNLNFVDLVSRSRAACKRCSAIPRCQTASDSERNSFQAGTRRETRSDIDGGTIFMSNSVNVGDSARAVVSSSFLAGRYGNLINSSVRSRKASESWKGSCEFRRIRSQRAQHKENRA